MVIMAHPFLFLSIVSLLYINLKEVKSCRTTTLIFKIDFMRDLWHNRNCKLF